MAPRAQRFSPTAVYPPRLPGRALPFSLLIEAGMTDTLLQVRPLCTPPLLSQLLRPNGAALGCGLWASRRISAFTFSFQCADSISDTIEAVRTIEILGLRRIALSCTRHQRDDRSCDSQHWAGCFRLPCLLTNGSFIGHILSDDTNAA